MFSEQERTFLALRFLDRERAKMIAKPVIDEAAPLLKELVDVGSAIYALCFGVADKEELHRPALALYRQVLELTDAIQILIENSCVDPIISLSRTALEAMLSLEYLFQKDYEHRSLVWRYYRLRRNLQEYDPNEREEEVNKFLEKYSEKMGPEDEFELTGMRSVQSFALEI